MNWFYLQVTSKLIVACHLQANQGLIKPSILWMGGVRGSGTRASRKNLIEEGGSPPHQGGAPNRLLKLRLRRK